MKAPDIQEKEILELEKKILISYIEGKIPLESHVKQL